MVVKCLLDASVPVSLLCRWAGSVPQGPTEKEECSQHALKA
jgi:hypothetical protein